jgi:hypothetical protein
MNSGLTWKLQKDDSDIDEFIDIRRKVGNQIIRKYLLDNVMNSNRVIRIQGKLKGPKNEFKDFAKFLILRISVDDVTTKFLAESGVYENLRIVAIDSMNVAQQSSEYLLELFTDALENPESYETMIILSDDSTVG